MLNLVLATLILNLFLPYQSSMAALSESQLLNLAQLDSPTWNKLKARGVTALSLEQQQLEQFTPSLFADTQVLKSEERPLNPFSPVIRDMNSWQLGVKKNLEKGIGVNGKIFSEQISNTFFENGTTMGASLGLEMDLHKNFLGSLTQEQLRHARASTLINKNQTEIDQFNYLTRLRKIYWSLVAIEESGRISKQLLTTSEKQFNDSKKRRRNNIADSGEVARYQSQVSARKASIQSLEYQRILYWQQLKSLVPSLNELQHNEELTPYNIDKTINKVLECAGFIESQVGPPLQTSLYKQYLDIQQEQFQSQQRVTDKHDNFDLKLAAEAKAIGKDFGTSAAFDSFSKDATPVYQLGLHFNIPLGKAPSETKNTQRLVERLNYNANRNDVLSKLTAYHQQTKKMIGVLTKVIKNQKLNAESLGLSLKVSKQKFNQARISLKDLLNDQDAYFSSSLQEIETKLSMIHTFFDYFSIYQKTPCQLNQAIAREGNK